MRRFLVAKPAFSLRDNKTLKRAIPVTGMARIFCKDAS
jgi:hypothetical protein